MKESRKVLYTKKALKESLLALLETKSLDKITVKELCQKADINRSTFYKHYLDVYDMVEKIENSIVEAIIEDFNGNMLYNNFHQNIIRIFQGLLVSKEDISLIFLNPSSMKCFSKLFDCVYDFAFPKMKKQFPTLTDTQIKHVYGFISRGCAEMVVSWLQNGMQETPEEMAQLLDSALKGEFYYS